MRRLICRETTVDMLGQFYYTLKLSFGWRTTDLLEVGVCDDDENKKHGIYNFGSDCEVRRFV